MAQRNRHDKPGRRHHIYNRGIAKRVMFPDPEAKQRLLVLLLCAVRRGEILIEAFSILDTHYHLIARSTDVPIHYPMMRVQNSYSRYFNRRFRRDGSVPRGRFGSSPILSLRYAFTAIRYTDFNPVKAKICTTPSDYPFGSARLYSSRADGPAWLSRGLVDGFTQHLVGLGRDRPSAYRELFGSPLAGGEDDVVRRRLAGPAREDDDLDRLMGQPPPRVAAWMRRKAKLADGLSPWAPIVGSEALLEQLRLERTQRGEILVRPAGRRLSAWPLLAAGLLHDTAGMGCEEIARRLRCAASTAGRRLRAHRDLLADDRDYALLAGRLVRRALEATYPQGLPL